MIGPSAGRGPIYYPPGTGGGSATGPTPGNCQTSAEAAATDYCQLDLSCDNDHISTNCYTQPGGTWYCYCSSYYMSQNYTVTAADASSACKAVSDVCSSGKVPEFTGPETCSVGSSSAWTGYCDLQQQCTQSAEVAPGVTAQIQNYTYAHCQDQAGQALCDCSGSTAYRSYQLSGATTADSCQTVADLCDQDVVFTGTPTCQPSYQAASTGYCEMQQQCTTATKVSDTATALLYDWQSTQCQDQLNGNTNCNCYSAQTGLRFDMASATTTLATCASAKEICAAASEIQLSGVVTCSPSYQSASTQYCDASLSCTQPATRGEQPLTMYGDLYVNCQLQTAGAPWTCSCSSGSQYATVQIDGTSGWAVCTTAAQRCPELVKVGTTSGSFPGMFPPGMIGPVPVITTDAGILPL
jgi:hypothetical protein